MYFTLKDLVQPFPLLFAWIFLLVLLNVRRQKRKQRTRWGGFLVPLLLLYLCSIPVIAFLAAAILERPYLPAPQRRPDNIKAIVALSGYYRPIGEGGKNFQLGEDTLYRCIKAAELYHHGEPCLIILSGGVFSEHEGAPSCASLMKTFLVQLGVRDLDVVIEDQSTSTYENAVECSKILRAKKIDEVVLVTDGTHLFRAASCFSKQGIRTVPVGSQYKSERLEWRLSLLFPSVYAARDFQQVWYEWLALAWYWSRGRI